MKRVALLMESSLEVSREILAGVIAYSREHEPWQLDFTPGGIGDQKLPHGWEGDGILARVPNAREAKRLAAHPAPKVLFDPLDVFVAPGEPLAACVRMENDHRAVGRLAADYFLARGFRHFGFVPAVLSSNPQMRYATSAAAEPNWSRLRRELTTDVIEEVRAHFGEKVYETVIPRNVRVSEAPSMGTPVVFLDARSKGAEAYKAFAWEFMAKNPTRFAAPPAAPVPPPPPPPAPAAEPAPAPVPDAATEPVAASDVPATDESVRHHSLPSAQPSDASARA